MPASCFAHLQCDLPGDLPSLGRGKQVARDVTVLIASKRFVELKIGELVLFL